MILVSLIDASKGATDAYLVALSGRATALAAASAHGAVSGNVSGLAALVAGLVVLHGLSAVSAYWFAC